MHAVKNFLVRRSSQVLAVLLALGTGLWVASGVVTGKAPTSRDTEPDAKPAEQVMNLVRVRPITAWAIKTHHFGDHSQRFDGHYRPHFGKSMSH